MRSNLFDAVRMLAFGLLIAGCGATPQAASPSSASGPIATATTPSAGASAPIASATPASAPVAEGPLLPRPSGDLAVGVRDLDPAGDFGIRAWYPAVAGTGTAAAAYATDQQWTDFGARFTNHTPAALERLSTSAATNAAPAASTGPRPVAVLMPGWFLPANSLTVLASDLASHGYIVITIDPPAGSELPPADLEKMLPRGAARLAAVRAVLKTLADPALADRVGLIDAGRVAVGGHSFGGLVSFAASTNEPRVAAAFDLDGMLGILPEVKPVTIPALLVAAELGGETDAGTLQVLRGSPDAVTVGLRRTAHCDLTDLPIILVATETNPADTLIGAECFGPIGRDGPTSTATIVRGFLDGALGTPSVVPTAASLIEGLPDGYIDPVGLGR